MATFSLFLESIYRDGNDGKAFEHFVKWFLKNDPEWSTQVDKVWLWDEWHGRWGPDKGIDLVFEDYIRNIKTNGLCRIGTLN